jgi:hypothetical protein
MAEFKNNKDGKTKELKVAFFLPPSPRLTDHHPYVEHHRESESCPPEARRRPQDASEGVADRNY